MKRTIFEGDVFETKYNGKIIITRYIRKEEIEVEFIATGYKLITDATRIKRGKLKDPYYPRVCGLGYLGEGLFKANINRKSTIAYKHWSNLLLRCYNKYHLAKRPNYRESYVCKEWLNFQNFAKWFYENYKVFVIGEEPHIDKDILIKGNKIYSPNTCCIVPKEINMLLLKSEKSRGAMPIGVRKNGRKYVASISIDGKKVLIGNFDDANGAFNAYKCKKEENITRVANKWKNHIPITVYEALLNYKISIND